MSQGGGLKGTWKAIFKLPGTTGQEALTAAELVANGFLENIGNLMVSFLLCPCSWAMCADQDHC